MWGLGLVRRVAEVVDQWLLGTAVGLHVLLRLICGY